MLTTCCIYRVLITLARVVSQVCTTLFVQGSSVRVFLGYFLVSQLSQTLLLPSPSRRQKTNEVRDGNEFCVFHFPFSAHLLLVFALLLPHSISLSRFLLHSLPLFATCFRQLTLYSFLGNKKGLKLMKLRNLRFWHFRLKIPNVNGIFPLFPAFFPLFVYFFC